MAYTKTTWVDEVPATSPVTYDIETVGTDLEISLHSTPSTSGTPVNATNLNKIEQGIEDAHALALVQAQHRQGDVGDWGNNSGTTNFDISDVEQLVQIGCVSVTSTGDTTVTFPTPFSVAPIIVATGGGGVSTAIMIVVTYVTTTSFHLSAWKADGSRANSFYTTWLAIGAA